MNFDKLKDEARDAFDMRSSPSLTALMTTFAKLDVEKDRAKFAHALRYGSMLNGLEFITSVTKRVFPYIPQFIVVLVHDKAETYIIQKLNNYEVDKNV